MNTETYTYLLANPEKISAEDLVGLQTIIEKYPYFQSARALQLRALKKQESFLYNDALKLAAAHTADRDILFEYITSDKFIQNEISQVIQQQDISIEDIPVIAEDVSEQIVQEKVAFQSEREKADAILSPDLFQRAVDSVKNIANQNETKEDEKLEKEDNSEVLAPDKPLEFTKQDTYSFSEWLKLTKAQPIKREKNSADKPNNIAENPIIQDRRTELIDRFIQDRPRINPLEAASREGLSSDAKPEIPSFGPNQESLMTETLAKVYLQQKNYKKAIQAYKILILKNPEKSGFFADQIRAIEKLINSEQS